MMEKRNSVDGAQMVTGYCVAWRGNFRWLSISSQSFAYDIESEILIIQVGMKAF
jgi:hypothetical protein